MRCSARHVVELSDAGGAHVGGVKQRTRLDTTITQERDKQVASHTFPPVARRALSQEKLARARRTVLHAALASCGIVEAHLSAAGSPAASSVFTPKPYRAQPTAVEQSLPQPLAIAPRRSVHFACPKSNCGGELLPSTERVLRCACGHSIDVAREGYVHLAKRTKASAEQQAESDAVTQLVEVPGMADSPGSSLCRVLERGRKARPLVIDGTRHSM